MMTVQSDIAAKNYVDHSLSFSSNSVSLAIPDTGFSKKHMMSVGGNAVPMERSMTATVMPKLGDDSKRKAATGSRTQVRKSGTLDSL